MLQFLCRYSVVLPSNYVDNDVALDFYNESQPHFMRYITGSRPHTSRTISLPETKRYVLQRDVLEVEKKEEQVLT